ncbi:hypothetical protein F4561_006555 [Lipingzhangella halophila]|uniref:Uncharacterized protein n=1 Tax=Lipingzhangella halophila TaxID=1783352 RepID=A0A7W7RPC2_9ACTN|nr:hypothetical protein [Lipingzhangella halophila]MBB4935646.1 hypothetical protein [Lipingzhangella halophila]
MTFDARSAGGGANRHPFPFIGMDGQRYELPHMKTVKSGLLQEFTGGSEEALEEIAGREVYEAIMEMSTGAAEDLVQAWADHSGTSGKAHSPSSQTRNRSKRRKRT